MVGSASEAPRERLGSAAGGGYRGRCWKGIGRYRRVLRGFRNARRGERARLPSLDRAARSVRGWFGATASVEDKAVGARRGECRVRATAPRPAAQPPSARRRGAAAGRRARGGGRGRRDAPRSQDASWAGRDALPRGAAPPPSPIQSRPSRGSGRTRSACRTLPRTGEPTRPRGTRAARSHRHRRAKGARRRRIGGRTGPCRGSAATAPAPRSVEAPPRRGAAAHATRTTRQSGRSSGQ